MPVQFNDNVVATSKDDRVSVNSKSSFRGIFLKGRIPPPPPGNRESAKPRLLGKRNSAKAPPPGQLFSKIQQKPTKHETEIKKNSTEMLICLEILKQ